MAAALFIACCKAVNATRFHFARRVERFVCRQICCRESDIEKWAEGQKEDTLSTVSGGGGGGMQRSNISKWRPRKSVREIYSSLAPFRFFLASFPKIPAHTLILHSRPCLAVRVALRPFLSFANVYRADKSHKFKIRLIFHNLELVQLRGGYANLGPTILVTLYPFCQNTWD